MRLRWVAVHHSSPTSFNMALPKLPKLGAMRGKMLKAKTSPSIKMGSRKAKIGPTQAVARGYATGKGMGRGTSMR